MRVTIAVPFKPLDVHPGVALHGQVCGRNGTKKHDTDSCLRLRLFIRAQNAHRSSCQGRGHNGAVAHHACGWAMLPTESPDEMHSTALSRAAQLQNTRRHTSYTASLSKQAKVTTSCVPTSYPSACQSAAPRNTSARPVLVHGRLAGQVATATQCSHFLGHLSCGCCSQSCACACNASKLAGERRTTPTTRGAVLDGCSSASITHDCRNRICSPLSAVLLEAHTGHQRSLRPALLLVLLHR